MSDLFDFEDNSEETIDAAQRALVKAATIIGMKAETYAKLLTPVDTGRLRNSINHKFVENENAVYIGTNVEYAPHQEYGTVTGVKGHHMIKKAAGDHTAEYKAIVKQCMDEAKGP